MLPLAALGALKGMGGGGGLPGMSDQSSSSATASVSLAGMSVGGGGRRLDSNAYLQSRLGGTTVAEPGMGNMLLLGAAGLLVAVLLMRGK